MFLGSSQLARRDFFRLRELSRQVFFSQEHQDLVEPSPPAPPPTTLLSLTVLFINTRDTMAQLSKTWESFPRHILFNLTSAGDYTIRDPNKWELADWGSALDLASFLIKCSPLTHRIIISFPQFLYQRWVQCPKKCKVLFYMPSYLTLTATLLVPLCLWLLLQI